METVVNLDNFQKIEMSSWFDKSSYRGHLQILPFLELRGLVAKRILENENEEIRKELNGIYEFCNEEIKLILNL